MNFSSSFFKSGYALGAILSLMIISSQAIAAPINVQSQATASNATAGESGATVSSSALINVLVTDSNGNPVSNLGSNIGNGNTSINLPTGWNLKIVTVPPGGCLVSPTQFSNQRNGVYSIRVVPFINNASCRWLSGDYIYKVQIDSSSVDGSTLGVLTIR